MKHFAKLKSLFSNFFEDLFLQFHKPPFSAPETNIFNIGIKYLCMYLFIQFYLTTILEI